MYRIVIQPIALKLLREINDRRIRQKISDRKATIIKNYD